MKWLARLLRGSKKSPDVSAKDKAKKPIDLVDAIIEIPLYQCSCGSLLKVLRLSLATPYRCPCCRAVFTISTVGGGLPLDGIMIPVLNKASEIAQETCASEPNLSCELCRMVTAKEKSYVASKDIILNSDLDSLLPLSELRNMEHFRQMVVAHSRAWLLCDRCARKVFLSALRNLFSVNAEPELLSQASLPSELKKYFVEYDKHRQDPVRVGYL